MKIKKLLKTCFIILFWAAVWQLTAVLVASQILLPTPLSVLRALLSLASKKEFYLSVAFTVLRISAGYVSGLLLGLLLGGLTFYSKLLNALLAPIAGIIKSTPVASFIVLLFVWFSNGTVAAITSMLIVLPIIWSSTFTAFSSADKELLEMARLFKVSPSKKLFGIYIPSAFSTVRASAATALGLAWKAGVAAEVICSPKNSIGGGIYSAKVYLETPELFAWTAVVIIVSVLIEKLLLKLIKDKRGAKDEA